MATDDNNGTVRCGLPDTIIGVGEAGKKVVYRYLQTDWIIEEGIEERNGNQPDFSAYAVDSATREQESDINTRSNINERIKSMAEDLGRSENLILNSASLQYVNLVDESDGRYISPAGLTSEDNVNYIARGSNIDSWWVKPNSEVAGDGNYETGVVRRRALSKALLHTADVSSNSIDEMTSNPGDHAAIVVGLGGGTGSGIFIDIARQLKNNGCQVFLYAILPHTDEPDRRKANAHAALSELESVSLTGQDPFKNIMLLPFAKASELEDKSEFHDAIVQSIVSGASFVDGTRDAFDTSEDDGPPKFAPFTLAVPRRLHYNIGEVKQVKDTLSDYCEDRRDVLDTEEELYEEVHSYIETHFDEDVTRPLSNAEDDNREDFSTDQFILTDEWTQSLIDRVNDIRGILKDPSVTDIGYNSVEEWSELIAQVESNKDDTYDSRDTKFKRDFLGDLTRKAIEGIPRNLQSEYAEASGEDLQFGKMIYDEFALLRTRLNIVRATRLIDEPARSGIQDVIRDDVGQFGIDADITEKRNELEDEVEERVDKKSALERVRVDVADKTESAAEEWWRDNKSEFKRLQSVRNHGTDAISLIDAVRDKMQTDIDRICTEDEADYLNPSEFDLEYQDAVDIEDHLSDMNVDPGAVTRDYIVDQLDAARRAKKAHLEANELGMLGRARHLDEKQDDYDQALRDLDNDFISIHPLDEESITDEDIRIEFKGDEKLEDRKEKIEGVEKSIIDDITTSLQRAIVQPSVDQQWLANHDAMADWKSSERPDIDWPTDDVVNGVFNEELRYALTGDLDLDDIPRTKAKLLQNDPEDGGIVYRAFYESIQAPVEAAIADVEQEWTEKEDDLEKWTDLIQLSKQIGGDWADEEVTESPDLVDTTGAELSKYELSKSPRGQAIPQGEGPDISDMNFLDEDNPEHQEIIKQIKNLLEDATTGSSYAPLVADGITASQGADGVSINQYDETRIANLFLGRNLPDDTDPGGQIFESVREYFADGNISAEMAGTGFQQQSVPFGWPWDIAVTTFIGGVFLDNIKPVVEPDGYLDAYRSMGGLPRHSYGLGGRDQNISPDPGTGGYVWRSEQIPLNKQTGQNDFLAMFQSGENKRGRYDSFEEYVREELQETAQFESADGVHD